MNIYDRIIEETKEFINRERRKLGFTTSIRDNYDEMLIFKDKDGYEKFNTPIITLDPYIELEDYFTQTQSEMLGKSIVEDEKNFIITLLKGNLQKKPISFCNEDTISQEIGININRIFIKEKSNKQGSLFRLVWRFLGQNRLRNTCQIITASCLNSNEFIIGDASVCKVYFSQPMITREEKRFKIESQVYFSERISTLTEYLVCYICEK